jgi:hypothetical protein
LNYVTLNGYTNVGVKSARAKGHSFELAIRDVFKDMGWDTCVSSRSESKNKDDQGIDLCFTDPFNVQCKAVEALGNYHKVLSAMPKDNNYNIVVHKRNRQGVVVSMTLEDFVELVTMLKSNQII